MAQKNPFVPVLGVVFACVVVSSFLESTEAVLFEDSKVDGYGCVCADYSCGCCVHMEVIDIGLNDTGCINITYLRKEYGISFTMTLDNLTIYNETVSARNPPPICFGAPYLEKIADLCVHFYDLNATMASLHGCVDVEARAHKIVVARYKVGCFNLGRNNLFDGSSRLWKKYHRRLVNIIRLRQSLNSVEKSVVNDYHALENEVKYLVNSV